MNSSLAIILVAKLPVAGKVKTRLFSRFTPAAAASLHERFLLHTVSRLCSLQLGQVVVLFDPPDQAESFKNLISDPVEFEPQSPGDLGDRLAACAGPLRDRFDRLLFLGSDSPDVPESHIRSLAQSIGPFQLAVGPTEDGGFWSIGFDRSVNVDSLLTDVPWSSGKECEAVLVNAAAMHLEVCVGNRWTDVDHPSDVDALLWRLEHSQVPADVRLFTQLERLVPQSDRSAAATNPSGPRSNEPSHA